MSDKQMPLVELTEEAVTILQRELGTADTIRFIRQFSSGFGDYTAERSTRQEETLDELIDAIKRRRLKNGTPNNAAIHADNLHQQRIKQIRQQYQRAYEKWTEEEDTLLRQKHDDGVGVQILSRLLQRQPGAIESRLRKLGLTN